MVGWLKKLSGDGREGGGGVERASAENQEARLVFILSLRHQPINGDARRVSTKHTQCHVPLYIPAALPTLTLLNFPSDHHRRPAVKPSLLLIRLKWHPNLLPLPAKPLPLVPPQKHLPRRLRVLRQRRRPPNQHPQVTISPRRDERSARKLTRRTFTRVCVQLRRYLVGD